MFFRKFSFVLLVGASINTFSMMAENNHIVEPEELVDTMLEKIEDIEIVGEVASEVYNMTIMIPESSGHERIEGFRDEVIDNLLEAGFEKVHNSQCKLKTGTSSAASADIVTPYEDLMPNAVGNPLHFITTLDDTHVLVVIVTLANEISIFYSIEIGKADNNLFYYILYFAHGSQAESIGRQGVKFKGNSDNIIKVLHYLFSSQLASSIEIVPFRRMEKTTN